jgi:transcriptional regulator GlxA family with amidase domain
MEMFGMLRYDGLVGRVVTVAMAIGPVASSQGPATIADFDFDTCPRLDVLIVPGGEGTRKEVSNNAIAKFLQNQAKTVEHLLSVCTGAALLAASGLISHKKATTNKMAFDWVTSVEGSEDVTWVKEARWIPADGRITTAAGVSAGMDAALHLIETKFGREMAVEVARRAEYTGDFTSPENDPFGKSTNDEGVQEIKNKGIT